MDAKPFVRAVCDAFGGDPDAVASNVRGPSKVARLRRIAMYLYVTQLDCSWARAGRAFERHPSTVRHAVEKFKADLIQGHDLIRLGEARRAVLLALSTGQV